jgi:hypothetical protein
VIKACRWEFTLPFCLFLAWRKELLISRMLHAIEQVLILRARIFLRESLHQGRRATDRPTETFLRHDELVGAQYDLANYLGQDNSTAALRKFIKASFNKRRIADRLF